LADERRQPELAPCRCKWCQGATCDCPDDQPHFPHDDAERGLAEALWVAHKFIFDLNLPTLHPVARVTLLACTRYAFTGSRGPYRDPIKSAEHWLHVHHGEEPVTQ
jgi:hypothetical protein